MRESGEENSSSGIFDRGETEPLIEKSTEREIV